MEKKEEKERQDGVKMLCPPWLKKQSEEVLAAASHLQPLSIYDKIRLAQCCSEKWKVARTCILVLLCAGEAKAATHAKEAGCIATTFF